MPAPPSKATIPRASSVECETTIGFRLVKDANGTLHDILGAEGEGVGEGAEGEASGEGAEGEASSRFR